MTTTPTSGSSTCRRRSSATSGVHYAEFATCRGGASVPALVEDVTRAGRDAPPLRMPMTWVGCKFCVMHPTSAATPSPRARRDGKVWSNWKTCAPSRGGPIQCCSRSHSSPTSLTTPPSSRSPSSCATPTPTRSIPFKPSCSVERGGSRTPTAGKWTALTPQSCEASMASRRRCRRRDER
jgi:hypothetical protein